MNPSNIVGGLNAALCVIRLLLATFSKDKEVAHMSWVIFHLIIAIHLLGK